MSSGRFDLIVFTQGTSHEFGELFRTERMFWITSPEGTALHQDPLPLACGTKRCFWRAGAVECADAGRASTTASPIPRPTPPRSSAP